MKGPKTYFTERMLRVISLAEEEILFTKMKVVMPVHLLIACLVEKTGVLGEISLKCDFDLGALRTAGEELYETQNPQPIINPYFNVPINAEVEKILEVANNCMKGYKQIYLNEGHLLKALITTGVIDSLLSDDNKKKIVTLGTTSRDMITHLGNYTFPEIDSPLIRKVEKGDIDQLVYFAEHQFSSGWAETIKNGLLSDNPSIYIAVDQDRKIIGFAAFDVYQNKKGYFGPMGVSEDCRTKGIGSLLVHHCLKDMKEIGYGYAIIGGAGPIEFYEKLCNAVVIPLFSDRNTKG